jgi:DNA-binding NarL/FixJ family response regulator
MRKRQVLLLEPEQWRFRGIADFLKQNGVEVAGPDPRDDADGVDVVLVPDERGAIGRVRRVVSDAPILTYGPAASIARIAEVIAEGARGYFEIASSDANLVKAIAVVADGGVWAPRQAVLRSVLPARAEASFCPELHEVLALLLEGLSNKEIANRLGLAEVTVKARLTRLYRQFGVTSRLQLLTAAIRQGVVGDR